MCGIIPLGRATGKFLSRFERGLRDWRRLLKPDGFLVVHEMTLLRPDPPPEIAERWQRMYPGIRTAAEYVAQMPLYGYEPIGHFSLPEDTWWLDHYGPLAVRIEELRAKYAEDVEAQEVLDQEQEEVDVYKRYAMWFVSAFYLMRKSRQSAGKNAVPSNCEQYEQVAQEIRDAWPADLSTQDLIDAIRR